MRSPRRPSSTSAASTSRFRCDTAAFSLLGSQHLGVPTQLLSSAPHAGGDGSAYQQGPDAPQLATLPGPRTQGPTEAARRSSRRPSPSPSPTPTSSKRSASRRQRAASSTALRASERRSSPAPSPPRPTAPSLSSRGLSSSRCSSETEPSLFAMPLRSPRCARADLRGVVGP